VGEWSLSQDTLVSGRITESKNHRVVGVGRDLCGSSSPTPVPKQGHPEQAAQDLVQAGLEYLQRRRLHNLPGQPFPGLRHPQSEEVLPHVQTEGTPSALQGAAPRYSAAACRLVFPIACPGRATSGAKTNSPRSCTRWSSVQTHQHPWPTNSESCSHKHVATHAPNTLTCSHTHSHTPLHAQPPHSRTTSRTLPLPLHALSHTHRPPLTDRPPPCSRSPPPRPQDGARGAARAATAALFGREPPATPARPRAGPNSCSAGRSLTQTQTFPAKCKPV